MYSCAVDFLAQPRSASRAIAKLLMDHCGAVQVGTHHAGPPQHQVKHPAFTVIRHPMDTFVSWFYWRGGAGKFNLDWIKDQVERHEGTYYWRLPEGGWSMWRWVTGPDRVHVPGLTILGYENLQDELDNFLNYHLGETWPLPVEGVSEKREGRPWPEFFDAEMIEWVTEQFALDWSPYQ